LHLRRSREDPLDVGDELLGAHAGRRGHRNGVELAFALEQLLRRRNREHHERGRAEGADIAVLRDPGHPKVPHGLQRPDANGLTDSVALFVRGAGVDHDFVRGTRPGSVDQPQRVEGSLRRIDPEAEGGRAAGVDRLPVRLEDFRPRLVDDTPRRGLDAV
jgi:hypothetical protein